MLSGSMTDLPILDIDPHERERAEADRFERWRRMSPGLTVRLLAIPGQVALDLADARDHQRALETWGTQAELERVGVHGGERMAWLGHVDEPVPFSRVYMFNECHRCAREVYYYAATNERGWRCSGCNYKPGEPAGYEPFIDRHCIESKVHGLLLSLHTDSYIYVSNNDCADGLASAVAAQCRGLDAYDQGTIIRLIFEADARRDENGDTYWSRISRGIRAGNDPRQRCPGGRLSTFSSMSGGAWTYRCLEHDCPSCGSEPPF